MPPTKWDEVNRNHLIHAIIHQGKLNPSPILPLGRVSNWNAIERALREKGLRCSLDAMQSQWVSARRQLATRIATANIPQDATLQQKLSIVAGIPIESNQQVAATSPSATVHDNLR
ncbi:hypothetical protein GGR57DRAFT_507878 [Xylariaceae sp. FL1272]|nr:hypothetical protein GGR57DRAFT_507878 [Xylariaceae sp. FL1272]